MNIAKLPSGNYRVRYSENGERKSFTVDHKPTQIEAMRLIVDRKPKEVSSYTFKSACESYISTKSNVLSHSTIRGYVGLIKAISTPLLNTLISDITLPMVQLEINNYSANHSPKSVRNMSGFIVGVLRYYNIDIKSPKLPQKEKKHVYIPTKEEVSAIFDEIKGSKFECAILLSAMGLRRSEICGATLQDLKGNILYINKAKVQGTGEKWHIKTTKTTESTRTIYLSDYIVSRIVSQGYIYDGYPSAINQYLHKVQDKLGIERFPLHKMRHFFASYMHNLGFSDKQIQDMGGWKTDNVMKNVYAHSMELDKAKVSAANAIDSLIS